MYWLGMMAGAMLVITATLVYLVISWAIYGLTLDEIMGIYRVVKNAIDIRESKLQVVREDFVMDSVVLKEDV